MENLKKNFLYNVGYQILIIIIPLITAPYVSRVLGVNGIGTYSYTYSIAYYFGLFAMLGVSNQGNRAIALSKKDKKNMSENFWNIYFIQLVCSIIAIALYLFFTILIFKGNKLIAFIDLTFVFSYMFDITWLYFGLEEFKTTVIRNTFFKILTLILIFIFVNKNSDLWIYALIMGGGTLLSQLYLWIPLKKYVEKSKIDFSIIKKNIKPVLFLFIPVLSYSIYKVMDKIMLGTLTSVYQVGIYENSEKIIGIPTGIITALGTVMMPRISALLSEKKEDIAIKYTKISFKYFTIIAIAMIFGLIGISNTLSVVYFGHEFRDCSKTISILSISILFLSWANIIRTQYLIPRKVDKPYIISTIVGAILNLIINLLLIPKIGANGAAIGTVIAEFSVFITQIIFIRKNIKNNINVWSLLYVVPTGSLMLVIILYLRKVLGVSILSLIMQVLLGGFGFLLIITCIQLFIKDELFMNIIKYKKKRKNNEK